MTQDQKPRPLLGVADDRAEPQEGVDTGAPTKLYVTSAFCSRPLPHELVAAVQKLESLLDMRIYLISQSDTGRSGMHMIGTELQRAIFQDRSTLGSVAPKKLGVLLRSYGGDADAAFNIVRLLRTYGGGDFTAIVPDVAKSAATLMAFGSEKLLLGRAAELGPLDAQRFDPKRERFHSALDEAHSLDYLLEFSLNGLDSAMYVLTDGASAVLKQVELLPIATDFVSKLMKPLMDNVDPIDYTQHRRDLAIAEQYAVRMLSRHVGVNEARAIANHFVEHYPSHTFVVDNDDLQVSKLPMLADSTSEEVLDCVDETVCHLWDLTAVGALLEMDDDKKKSA